MFLSIAVLRMTSYQQFYYFNRKGIFHNYIKFKNVKAYYYESKCSFQTML